MEMIRKLPSVLVIWILLLLVQTHGDLLDGNCRIYGVFHIGKTNRYQMSMEKASSNCQTFGAQLATEAQVERANQGGFDVCRYGWVADGYPVISRVTPVLTCGNNQTGVLKNSVVIGLFDGFCIYIKDADKANTCEPLLQITTTEMSMIKTASPTLLDLTHAETVSTQPFETTFQRETETSGLPIADSELPIPTAAPTHSAAPSPNFSTTTSLISTTEVFSAVVNSQNNRWVVIISLLVTTVFLIIIILLILICCYRRCKNTFAFSSVPPKETVEVEVWNHNLVDDENN